jgi:ribosomal protein L22
MAIKMANEANEKTNLPEKPKPAEAAKPKEAKPKETETKVATKKGPKTATAKLKDARVSLKKSKLLFKVIRGKRVDKSKALLEGLISQKRSLAGKYYTNTAKKILELLINAEASAKAKTMDESRLSVIYAKASKGRTFMRPRSRMGRRGEVAKMSHLEIILGER